MRYLIFGSVLGVISFIALFGFVVATGQTFGQRCTAMEFAGSAHAECVNALSEGRAR